jgi:hypothetical protein
MNRVQRCSKELHSDCSVYEKIAARGLLRRWLEKYAGTCKPGGWEYDHDAADLCQTTADFLGVGDPWS